MKTSPLSNVAMILITASITAQAAPKMRDAATHDQLSLALRKAELNDPMKNLQPAKGPDPSLVNQPKDLISQSDIISFNGLATLVPKRAILNLPPKMADRINKMPTGSRIQGWLAFYQQNRGWITTVEVSRRQAEGNDPLAEELAERVRKSSNLVVATYMGGPISVLPQKEKKEESVTLNQPDR